MTEELLQQVRELQLQLQQQQEFLQQHQADQPQQPTVAAIAASLPPFWGNTPVVWFHLAQANFSLATPRVTREEAKFYYVLKVLPQDVAQEVIGVIKNPDPVQPYTKLKHKN